MKLALSKRNLKTKKFENETPYCFPLMGSLGEVLKNNKFFSHRLPSKHLRFAAHTQHAVLTLKPASGKCFFEKTVFQDMYKLRTQFATCPHLETLPFRKTFPAC